MSDMFTARKAPFDDGGRLSEDRDGRVAQLHQWLARFPAFKWMGQQPAIVSSKAKFETLKKRRQQQARFADDLADFRFWAVVTCAVLFAGHAGTPSPSAAQRKQATTAAKTIQQLATTSALLQEAGLDYSSQLVLLKGLEQLVALSSVKRRARTDDFTADRKFIELLVHSAMRELGDAPPSLICELAALQVKSPDVEAIKKLVAAYKKTFVATT